MVLALAANTRNLVHKNRIAAHDLATRAIAINPTNPMGWWASSVSQLFISNLTEGAAHARTGQLLARRSPLAFWWEAQIGFTAMLRGDHDTAIEGLERSALLLPDFRPALRYLVGIYASRGQKSRALRIAQHLKRVETDFSLDRMTRDPDYPASLLAKTPGIDMTRISAVPL